MAVGRYVADFLQRMPWSAGSDAVDAAKQLAANGPRQVRAQVVRVMALECAARAPGVRTEVTTDAICQRLHSTERSSRSSALAPNPTFGIRHPLAALRVHAA